LNSLKVAVEVLRFALAGFIIQAQKIIYRINSVYR